MESLEGYSYYDTPSGPQYVRNEHGDQFPVVSAIELRRRNSTTPYNQKFHPYPQSKRPDRASPAKHFDCSEYMPVSPKYQGHSYTTINPNALSATSGFHAIPIGSIHVEAQAEGFDIQSSYAVPPDTQVLYDTRVEIKSSPQQKATGIYVTHKYQQQNASFGPVGFTQDPRDLVPPAYADMEIAGPSVQKTLPQHDAELFRVNDNVTNTHSLSPANPWQVASEPDQSGNGHIEQWNQPPYDVAWAQRPSSAGSGIAPSSQIHSSNFVSNVNASFATVQPTLGKNLSAAEEIRDSETTVVDSAIDQNLFEYGPFYDFPPSFQTPTRFNEHSIPTPTGLHHQTNHTLSIASMEHPSPAEEQGGSIPQVDLVGGYFAPADEPHLREVNSQGGIRIARLPPKRFSVPYEIPAIPDMTVSQLKTELKKRGLPAIGKKSELQARLEQYLESTVSA